MSDVGGCEVGGKEGEREGEKGTQRVSSSKHAPGHAGGGEGGLGAGVGGLRQRKPSACCRLGAFCQASTGAKWGTPSKQVRRASPMPHRAEVGVCGITKATVRASVEGASSASSSRAGLGARPRYTKRRE